MLSDDPAVAAGRVEVELLSHEVAETCGVQVGARADDAVTREAAQLPGHVGQDVHWRGLQDEGTTLRNDDLQALLQHPSTLPHATPRHTSSPARLTWVRHHHQDAVGAVLDDVRDDELEDVDVALHQVQAALALLLAGTSGHHHHSGIGCHTVV